MQGLADGFVADGIDHFEFHELVGQQAQAPACVAIRRLLTAQRNHLGLLACVELALTRPDEPGLAFQRSPAALVILASRPFNSRHTEGQCLGNLDVAPAAVSGVFVGQEQGSRPSLSLRTASASIDQLFQPEACLGLQCDAMLLEHPPSQHACLLWQLNQLTCINKLSLTHH